MPRIVDHDQRRRELAETVWALIREHGVEGVNLRLITVRSGWSSGAIRHYLPHREAVLTFAAEHMARRIEARFQGISPTDDPLSDFLKLVWEVLPLDDERRAESQVWLAFVGLSVSDPGIADTQGVAYQALNEALRHIFEGFSRLGWLRHQTPETAACEIQALIDGLNLHLLLGQITPGAAWTAVEGRVRQLIGPP
ncbi:TetR family transcriptional regulator C-terminal domain-containing protein [Deinococcus rubellus]|uniref:TetR family transcriptional regulator C-terminal domain-containing protein n=1 Tax=Deinococcus rubellus TaxID=1889240 RepID=A0ABY5YIR9_9DEIO|nr:TetR family transcriptional regulator C-terminal domain-containing protein [Deinococcus rubellus]UWX65028.1 TetR family transcriptional regulator C-terminal domain-containing protein [Deinococcus rubellus]